MANLRIMVMNYSKLKQSCRVTFSGDPIAFLKCSTSRSALDPDETIVNAESPYDLEVPPGEICGFIAESEVTIVNPAPGSVHIVTAAGKDPWPPPPAAPSAFENLPDFAERYQAFEHGGGAGEEDASIQITYAVLPGAARSSAQHHHPKAHHR